jgi:hypothetical protein
MINDFVYSSELFKKVKLTQKKLRIWVRYWNKFSIKQLTSI